MGLIAPPSIAVSPSRTRLVKDLFSENATNLDVSVSDTRFNDISAGTRHLLRSTGQFGTVLNTVDLAHVALLGAVCKTISYEKIADVYCETLCTVIDSVFLLPSLGMVRGGRYNMSATAFVDNSVLQTPNTQQ